MSISFTVGPDRIRFAAKTDVGRKRANNEDNFLLPQEMALGVVSDGMGGHACGDVASRITVETIDKYFRDTARSRPPTFPLLIPSIESERARMATAIQYANTRIFDAAAADPKKKSMGCTVEAIYFTQGRYYIGHVGDSRVYRIRNRQLQLLTEDHSLLNDWKRMKELAGSEVVNFPHKNVVVRALGLNEQVKVDVVIDEYQRDDLFLLCSDGLCDMIKDREILELCLKYDRLDSACNELINAANEAGGLDNITALLVRIEKAG